MGGAPMTTKEQPMMELSRQTCGHIPEGTPAFTNEEVGQHLARLPGWAVERGKLTKTFSFANHYESGAFANAVVWISHRQDHHPDINLGYSKVTVSYSTHTVNGLSVNDFICAARVEALFT